MNVSEALCFMNNCNHCLTLSITTQYRSVKAIRNMTNGDPSGRADPVGIDCVWLQLGKNIYTNNNAHMPAIK